KNNFNEPVKTHRVSGHSFGRRRKLKCNTRFGLRHRRGQQSRAEWEIACTRVPNVSETKLLTPPNSPTTTCPGSPWGARIGGHIVRNHSLSTCHGLEPRRALPFTTSTCRNSSQGVPAGRFECGCAGSRRVCPAESSPVVELPR